MSDEDAKTTDPGDGAWLSVPVKPAAYEIPAHLVPRLRPTAPPHHELPIYRRFSPRRNRWAAVAAFDERSRELEQRVAS
jgi:hypothetical protein